MKTILMGNHAASWGAQLARVKVISAYPITPQTQVVEMLSEMCADGSIDAKFIKVESEHSAMAAIIAASTAGARAFTATSSHGLALMHELLHWASGARLPLVMVNVNRAMGPGWNIWSEQTDSLAQRDTGWLQYYVENNQEVLDTVLQAFRVAEDVLLPVMVSYDAFFLSHTYEPVDVPAQEEVDRYLPEPRPRQILDVKDPRAFYGLTQPDIYMELRYRIQKAHERAIDVAGQADEEWFGAFGRKYGRVEAVDCDDAETVLVTSCSTVSPARILQRALREKGEKVGLLKIRLFRPFPTEDVRKALLGAKKAVVIDRNTSFGKGGIFADEIRAVLAGEKEAPKVFGYITGLGGRDITPDLLETILREAMDSEEPEEYMMFRGMLA